MTDRARIRLPQHLGYAQAIATLERVNLNVSRGVVDITLDCKLLTSAEPFGLMLTALLAAELREAGISLRALGCDIGTTAYQMGFLEAVNDLDRLPSILGGSFAGRRVALATVRTRDIAPPDHPAAWSHKRLEAIADDLANTLTAGAAAAPGPRQILAYALFEILRNALEHGRVDACYLCTRFSPDLDRCDIAVGDKGIGIVSSLRENPRLHFSTPQQALSLAMLPGVSSKVARDPRFDNADVYANTGWGLYVLSELCFNDGHFALSSSGAIRRRTEFEDRSHSAGPSGTIVGASLNTSAVASLAEKTGPIVKRGMEIAKRTQGAIVTAVGASHGIHITTEPT